MTTKKLVLLAGVALALVAAACLLKGGKRNAAPSLNGKKMLPDFAVADVARIEIGDSLTLAAGPEGWRIETMQNYPADATRIVENLLALGKLKVGQVVRGRELREKTPVVLRDAKGAELASVTLGERHERWGFGRYAAFKGETVLVTDMLDAFGSDPMRWCDAKIVDEPYIRFNALADAALADDVTGLATGIVHTVTIAGDTNRVATIGAAVPGGTDRYLKLDNSAWTYIVPAYSVEKLLPKEEEPKAESAVDFM